MSTPTERDRNRARGMALSEGLARNGGVMLTVTGHIAARLAAQALADERARIVAWLRDLATRPPHADINPRAFALQVECIRTAAHLLEQGAADALESGDD